MHFVQPLHLLDARQAKNTQIRTKKSNFTTETSPDMYTSEKTTPLPSDDELLTRYRTDGRTEHLAELYTRYTELVYGMALHYLRNRADAEDAVMQLFEELIAKVRHHEIRHFRNWLHSVCRNLCLMRLRQAGKMPPAELPNELPDDGQLVDLLADEERRLRIAEALDRCLERLPEPQQRSIRLFFFDRCSYADIAAVTAWHLKSVRSYIQNGKRNLKICLEKNRP